MNKTQTECNFNDMQTKAICPAGSILTEVSRSKIQETNLEPWVLKRILFEKHKHAEFNWIDCFLQERRSVFGSAHFGEGGTGWDTTQHFGGL